MPGFELEADWNDPNFPLELNVVNNGSGVSGLICTVAIRLAGTVASYLDWNDYIFKTFGWVTKNQFMVDLGTGVYQTQLAVSAMGFTPLTGLPVELVAEYTQSGGSGCGAMDEITVSELRPATTLSRQYNTNRSSVLAPGNFTLYEDDGVTVLSVQSLTDATGGPTVDVTGAPQKRGPAPP